MSKNSGDNSVATRPGKRGGKLLKGGKKGNRGGTGRPPDEFKKRMRELASSKEVEAYLQRCLNGEFGPKFFLAARADVLDRGYGKATQPLDIKGKIDFANMSDEDLEELYESRRRAGR